MGQDATAIVLNYVIPALAMVLANCMFLSPTWEVLRIRRSRALGETNPIPFPMVATACSAFVIYSIVKYNLFLFFSNVFGAVFGIFFTISCMQFSSSKMQDTMLAIWCASASLFSAAGLLSVTAIQEQANVELLWGSMCDLALIVYYTAPLSTLAKVIRTRCSASIYWPLALLNAMNGGLWTAYGLAIQDWFVMAPNCLGCLLSLAALALSFLLPRQPQAEPRVVERMPATDPRLYKASSAHELLSSVSSSRTGSGCGAKSVLQGGDQAAGTRMPHSIIAIPGDDVISGTH